MAEEERKDIKKFIKHNDTDTTFEKLGFYVGLIFGFFGLYSYFGFVDGLHDAMIKVVSFLLAIAFGFALIFITLYKMHGTEEFKFHFRMYLIIFILFFGFLFWSAFFAPVAATKPVIYLYPESKTELEVNLSNPERITCDYPDYEDGWKVVAEPSGDLFDLDTGKKLYSLYYE